MIEVAFPVCIGNPGVLNDRGDKDKEEAMTFAREMVLAHPGTIDVDIDALSRCIDECLSCAQSCTACADACIAEETVAHLRQCIYFCLNCADVCETTEKILSRTAELDRGLARAILPVCAETCRICGIECKHHAEMGMKHCEVCEEACKRCQAACEALLAVL